MVGSLHHGVILAEVTLTVGIDIGTTAVKAVAVDDSGAIVGRARVPHRLVVTHPNRLEHDAREAWWEGPRRAWRALGAPGVSAVAVTAMVPAMTAVGSDGRPVAPGLLYGDERGSETFDETGAVAGVVRGPESEPSEGGNDPGSSRETLRFVRWLAAAAPTAAGYWHAQAVANRALGGEAALDFGSAFSSGPLFNGSGWDPGYCRDCGTSPEQLPAVRMFGEAVGRVEAGPGRGAIIAAGSVDAFSEQLVAGVEQVGDVLMVCGSTLVVWAVAEGWPQAAGLWTVPYHLPGRAVVGGASNAGGLFLDWVDRLIRPDERVAAGDASHLDPGAVPVWWPYIRGERAPLYDPGRRAALAGLDLTQGPGHVRRAAYEASAFAARSLIDRAAAVSGRYPERIVATGGGTRVRGWMQAVADVVGVPVHPLAVAEGAALGAAFLARIAAGVETSPEDAGRWGATTAPIEPHPDWVKPAADRYQRFMAGPAA
jgi:xylulokinase